jgi:MFS family permease
VGLLVAAFSIAQVTCSPLWGRFSDRWGRRPALLLGLAGSAIAFLIFGFATSLWLLFVSRLVQGVSGGTTSVMQAYVADSVAPEDRAKVFGWLSAATSAGVMIGPALGSLSWLLGLGPEAPGVLAAGLCTINLVFAWRWLPESRAGDWESSTENVDAGVGTTHDPRPKSLATMIWETIRYPKKETSELIWIYSVAMLAFSALTGVLGLFLMQRFHLRESNIGFIFLFLGLISVVMRAGVLGYLVQALGEVRVMRLGAVLMAIGLASYPLPSRFAVLLLVMALVPIGQALLFPSTTGLLSRRGGKDQLGQLMGVQQAFGGVARIMGPLGAGAVFQYVSTEAPFYAAAVIVAFAAVLSSRLRPEPRR